jgi:hypothetical protein
MQQSRLKTKIFFEPIPVVERPKMHSRAEKRTPLLKALGIRLCINKLLLIVGFSLALVMDHMAFLLGGWFFDPKGYVGEFKESVGAGRATGTVLPCAISCRPFKAISPSNPKAV